MPGPQERQDFHELSTSKEYFKAIEDIRHMVWDTPKGWFWKAYMTGITWVVFLTSCFLLLTWPVSHLYLHAKIAEFTAVRATIQLSRMQHPPNHDAEMRGMSVIIAQWNGWLAFWKKTQQIPLVGIYVPTEIQDVQPIE